MDEPCRTRTLVPYTRLLTLVSRKRVAARLRFQWTTCFNMINRARHDPAANALRIYFVRMAVDRATNFVQTIWLGLIASSISLQTKFLTSLTPEAGLRVL